VFEVARLGDYQKPSNIVTAIEFFHI
jgi:hypothetical protein